jgi:hypothetical protein
MNRANIHNVRPQHHNEVAAKLSTRCTHRRLAVELRIRSRRTKIEARIAVAHKQCHSATLIATVHSGPAAHYLKRRTKI